MKIIMIVGVLFLLFIIRTCFKYPAKSRSSRRLRLLLIAGILGVIAICAFLEFAPRGLNSLFDKAGEGLDFGSDDKQTYANGGSPDQSSDRICITVSQSTIEINGKRFLREKDYDGCEEYLESLLNGKVQVIVKDDYAVSAAYHYITDLLTERQVDYTEETAN